MLPHPTTMTYAWDKEELRGSQLLIFEFGLAIAVLFVCVMLLDRAPIASSTVAAELSTRETHLSAPALAVFSAE